MSRHEQHDNASADALWWLRGFEAAASSDQKEVVHRLWVGLRGVRDWLSDLTLGRVRVLGITERERAVVLTEAEMERLYDGLRPAPTAEDVADARATITAVFDQVRREAAEPRADEIPF